MTVFSLSSSITYKKTKSQRTQSLAFLFIFSIYISFFHFAFIRIDGS
ncbi:hypothetical protein QY96_03004 [Bacillus thermotolerans]|nr:hypothetical protein QY96_03004 [Bacillus thermotolerans]